MQVTCLIVICVAGAALSQLNVHIVIPNPPPTPIPGEPNLPPLMGRPAVILALIAACPCLFVTLGIAMLRVLQIRLTGISFSNPAVALIFSYLVSVLHDVPRYILLKLADINLFM